MKSGVSVSLKGFVSKSDTQKSLKRDNKLKWKYMTLDLQTRVYYEYIDI